jgi:predicted sulfurtransferase
MFVVKWLAILFGAALFAGAVLLSAQITSADKVPRITKERLKPLIGDPDVTILDARVAREWDSSPAKIKGAVRIDTSNSKTLMEKLPKDKTLVFY